MAEVVRNLAATLRTSLEKAESSEIVREPTRKAASTAMTKSDAARRQHDRAIADDDIALAALRSFHDRMPSTSVASAASLRDLEHCIVACAE